MVNAFTFLQTVSTLMIFEIVFHVVLSDVCYVWKFIFIIRTFNIFIQQKLKILVMCCKNIHFISASLTYFYSRISKAFYPKAELSWDWVWSNCTFSDSFTMSSLFWRKKTTPVCCILVFRFRFSVLSSSHSINRFIFSLFVLCNCQISPFKRPISSSVFTLSYLLCL